jgi:hypothetical protein
VAVCLVLSAAHGQSASGPALAPANTFHLASLSAGERVSDFAATSTGLYFLVNRDRMSESGSKIVQTDLQGTTQNVIAAPGGPNHTIAADEWGNVAVYQGNDRGQALLLFNARGVHVATLTPPGPVHSFAVRRHEVAWIAWDGSVMQTAPASDPRVLFRMEPTSAPPKLFWPGENKLLAVERVSAELVLFDAAARTAARARLAAPEISVAATWNRARQTGDGVGLTVSASAMHDGNVYLLLTPYRIAEGAPIVRFDEKGQLMQSLRCVLPMTRDRGALSPLAIGVHKGMLVIVSGDGAVAVYAL